MSDETAQHDHDATRARAASLPWFHAPIIPETQQTIDLDPDEAHHAVNARRKDASQPIVICDGRGTIAVCSIQDIGKRGRSLIARVEQRTTLTPPTPRLTIATALPKGDRQSTMLNMLAQLGVATIIPLETERSVVKPAASFATRAQRILIEACKQSRNPFVPELHDTTALDAAVNQHDGFTIIAHPGHDHARTIIDNAKADHIMVCIGPEGGFSDNELNALDQHTARAALGNTILRIETAAVAAATLVMMNPNNSTPGR